MSTYTHERLLFSGKENCPWFGWIVKTNYPIPRGGAVRIDIPTSQSEGEVYVTPQACTNATDQRMCLGYAVHSIDAGDSGFVSAGANCTYVICEGTLTNLNYIKMSTTNDAAFEISSATPSDGTVCGMVMESRDAPSSGNPEIGHCVIFPMRL